MADVLRAINKELKVKPEEILDLEKKLLNPKDLRRKKEQIENLEKKKNDL